jgi:S1-C subfamily serine protease
MSLYFRPATDSGFVRWQSPLKQLAHRSCRMLALDQACERVGAMSRRTMCLWLMAAALLLTSCGGGDEQAKSTTTNGTSAEAGAAPPVSDIYFGALDVRPPTEGTTGLFVRGVERGSPAATAGIQHGDVIAAVDGAPIRNVPDIIDAMNGLPAAHDASDVVPVEVLRGSEKQTLKVILGANVYLGANIREASGKGNGVLVVSAKDPASAAGIRHGDLITAIDGKPVTTVDGLFAVLGTHQPGDEVVLTISRGSGVRRVSVTLAPRPHVG